MDLFASIDILDKASAVAIMMVTALLVITDRLVWHTRLKKAEERADRWEQIAFSALSDGAAAGVRAAEVAAEVVSAIPDHRDTQEV